MTLLKLLEGVSVTKLYHAELGQMVQTQDVQIRGVQCNSRRVTRGDLFVAICGTSVDGHCFIQQAISAGAKAVVLEDDRAVPDALFRHTRVVKVVVGNSRRALAKISSNYYGHPSRKLRLIGVTGTNGKTTTTYLIRSILESNGEKTGLIGTIEYKLGEDVQPAVHTTPESLELNGFLSRMVKNGCRSAVMEVSSHALQQDRVYGFDFDAAVFTNLTQDHLDYHGSMESYLDAKKSLFDMLDERAIAVYNSDNAYAGRVILNTRARKIAYGARKADVILKSASHWESGMVVFLEYRGREIKIESSLIGEFNAENIAGAVSTGIGLGIPLDRIQDGIRNLTAVRGRFEKMVSPAGWIAIVDYAHTPDALERSLRAIRAMREKLSTDQHRRIITVFGCGGNRDRGKRPKMGRIASELSDVTIVSSDNPRFEDPESIIDEVMEGVKSVPTVNREADRKKAIIMALEMARPGDFVLIAGKGHESYQVIGDQKVHLDDREVVERFIEEHQA